jgi:para-aminobenzoate synthetase/4-amino-4-deoxychorismate lyase
VSSWARFDDLVDGTALAFPPPSETLVARHVAEVAPVLEAVDRATQAGRWAVGFVSYEAAPGLDDALVTAAPAPDGLPLAWFALTGPPQPVPVVGAAPPGRYRAGDWVLDWPEAEHLHAVDEVRRHIEAGDLFQGNLTTRLRTTVSGDLAAFYAEVALNQRPRYAALLDLGEGDDDGEGEGDNNNNIVVASASPELFFRWSGDELLTRPMKGTAPRGRTPDEDAAARAALLASAKERAENVIVVDLLRNDVGRVATTGSVRADVLCRAERYETVWQLTSDVTGQVPAATPLVDVFRALFPCGSVTGAPKPRAMQIIREVERGPRGLYCGAVGWVAPPKAPVRATFSVAIRTAVVDRGTGEATYGAGGGITWSSDPAAELAEVRAKSEILNRPHREFTLFETFAAEAMTARPGAGMPRLDRHLARLAASAHHLGFRYDEAQVREALRAVPDGAGLRVRLDLHRDGRVDVTCRPMPISPSPPGGPVRLVVDDEPVDPRRWELFHKTSLRDTYERRAARHPEADDVVLVNDRGEVTETTIATLVVQLRGGWFTPPLSAGCLPGVERGWLLEEGVLVERRLTVADLHTADAIAVVNSLRGWRDAVLV